MADGSWYMNISAPLPLGDNSALPWLPECLGCQGPGARGVAGSITHPLSAAFPSLPHFPIPPKVFLLPLTY